MNETPQTPAPPTTPKGKTGFGAKVSAVWRKKIAGIPMAYIAIGIAAVALFFAFRLKSTTSSSADSGADTIEGDATETPGTSDGTLPGTGSDASNPVFDAPDDPIAGTPTKYTDNDEWASAAVSVLTTDGKASAIEAGNAIAAYLDGGKLSTSQAALIDYVVKKIGMPPYLSAPVITSPSKTAERQGNPPTWHTVMGAGDDTPEKLATLYYGASNVFVVNTLKSGQGPGLTANNQAKYAVGERILVPKLDGTTDSPNLTPQPPSTLLPVVTAPPQSWTGGGVAPGSTSPGSIPDNLKGTAAISAAVAVNETMATFQRKTFNQFGFTASTAELRRLNPGKPDTIDKMTAGKPHGANTLIIKAAG